MAAGSDDEGEIARALLRNDLYLQKFIEALSICPFAKTCRETGRLHREVQLLSEADVDKVAARIVELESDAAAEIEVGLLIFPRLKLSAAEFVRFTSDVQRRYQNPPKHARKDPTQYAFFVVAFHPELAVNLKNSDVAVRFMRRSPDPTIQLVRPEAIERVRGERTAESLSKKIAEAGLRAVQQAGPEKLLEALAEMKTSYR